MNALKGLMMNGKQGICLLVAVLVAGIGVAAVVGDYSILPPAAKDLHMRLDATKIKLADAVKAAQELTGGIAQSASARVGSIEVQYEIVTVTSESASTSSVVCRSVTWKYVARLPW